MREHRPRAVTQVSGEKTRSQQLRKSGLSSSPSSSGLGVHSTLIHPKIASSSGRPDPDTNLPGLWARYSRLSSGGPTHESISREARNSCAAYPRFGAKSQTSTPDRRRTRPGRTRVVPRVQGRGLRAMKSSAISSKVDQRMPSCPLMCSINRSSMSKTCGRPDTSGWMVIGKIASSISR